VDQHNGLEVSDRRREESHNPQVGNDLVSVVWRGHQQFHFKNLSSRHATSIGQNLRFVSVSTRFVTIRDEIISMISIVMMNGSKDQTTTNVQSKLNSVV
jgi:hypothetical protein